MHLFLTGGTGYIGAAVLDALLSSGHQVTAAVRPDTTTDGLTAAGARLAEGQLTNVGWLTAQLAEVDGAVHCASPNDATSATVDRAVLNAVTTAFAGSGRPHVHTHGTWIHGSPGQGQHVTERTPFAPPPLVAWRPAMLRDVRAAARLDIRTVAISPGNVYGDGRGIPAALAHGPRTQQDLPALLFPGDGDQHVSNVLRDDLARLYVLALTAAPAGSYYLAANGASPTMREVAVAASRGQGLDGRVAPEEPGATRDRFGPLADALLLDQQVDDALARGLGWQPTGPTLLDELATGSYASAPVGTGR